MCSPDLPSFAYDELKSLLQVVWNKQAQAEATVQFESSQIVVSVAGGEVVTGGAPLEVIVNKVQAIQSLFFRTAEFLKDLPLRKKGPPQKEIHDLCRPWLFQTAPGSYQFIVAIQKPPQGELFPDALVEPDQLTETFLRILQASTDDDSTRLDELVPELDYRNTFLRLTRNLAPNGKTFERMVIKSTEQDSYVALSTDTRKVVRERLNKNLAFEPSAIASEKSIVGILRAVDLDSDWLEVQQEDGDRKKVVKLTDVIDDTIGPMVNHKVTVRTRELSSNRYEFLDIESDD